MSQPRGDFGITRRDEPAPKRSPCRPCVFIRIHDYGDSIPNAKRLYPKRQLR